MQHHQPLRNHGIDLSKTMVYGVSVQRAGIMMLNAQHIEQEHFSTDSDCCMPSAFESIWGELCYDDSDAVLVIFTYLTQTRV